MPWNLVPRVRSAMISDSLDVVGVRNNAMDIRVSALRPGMRAVGLAATVQFVPAAEYDQKDPYGTGIDFLDTLQPGEIAIIATGGECLSAF
jgi:regulator of RNase E activity RraA